eukprot:contig_17540_g4290
MLGYVLRADEPVPARVQASVCCDPTEIMTRTMRCFCR